MKINYKTKSLVPEVVNGFKVGDYCMGPGAGIYKITGMKPQLLTDEQYAMHSDYYDTQNQVPDLTTGKWKQVPTKAGDVINILFSLKQVYNSVGTPTKTKKELEAPFTNCYKPNWAGLVKNAQCERDRYQKKVDLMEKRIKSLEAAKKAIEDEDKDKAEIVSGCESQSGG